MLGLASVAAAQSTNYVYITGSTAFRGAIYDAFAGTTVFDSAPSVAVYNSNAALDPHTGGNMDFEGQISGANYIIKCAWSGSEAGVGDVVSTTQTRAFVNDIGVGGVAAGVSSGSAPSTVNHTVDLAMADNSQAASKTKSPVLTQFAVVGIIPFTWCKNAQGHPFPAGTYPVFDRITNVTYAQIRVALTGGTKAALITGVSTDTTNYVYVSGRDNNSGTRVNTLADSGYGITKSVSQYNIQGSGGVVTNLASVGNGGQASGGTLANTMILTGSATNADNFNGGTGWYAIGYMGMPDFLETAQPGDAVGLTLNGVAESTAAIQEGKYSFWGREHILAKNAPNLTAAAQTVFNKLTPAAIGALTDGLKTINITTMNATKTTDLSDPTHN